MVCCLHFISGWNSDEADGGRGGRELQGVGCMGRFRPHCVHLSLDRPGPIVELLKLNFESEFVVLSLCNSVVVVPYFSSMGGEVALSIQPKIGFEVLTIEPKEHTQTDDCKAPTRYGGDSL